MAWRHGWHPSPHSGTSRTVKHPRTLIVGPETRVHSRRTPGTDYRTERFSVSLTSRRSKPVVLFKAEIGSHRQLGLCAGRQTHGNGDGAGRNSPQEVFDRSTVAATGRSLLEIAPTCFVARTMEHDSLFVHLCLRDSRFGDLRLHPVTF